MLARVLQQVMHWKSRRRWWWQHFVVVVVVLLVVVVAAGGTETVKDAVVEVRWTSAGVGFAGSFVEVVCLAFAM